MISRSEHMRLHRATGEIVSVLGDEGKKKLCVFNSSVTEDVARRIKYGNESPKILIAEFGISRFTISRIRLGKTWLSI